MAIARADRGRLALVYAGRQASFSLGRDALILVGFVFLLSGGVLDTRLRYQERGGLARVMEEERLR